MVAYSFNQRFEAPIEAGTKSCTIRAIGRRRHARAGETVQLYVGQRTRHCRLLGAAVCTAVDPITINIRRWQSGPTVSGIHLGIVDGIRRRTQTLDMPDALDAFARTDGFADRADMAAFWWATHRDLISYGEILFSGVRIQWAPLGGPHELD